MGPEDSGIRLLCTGEGQQKDAEGEKMSSLCDTKVAMGDGLPPGEVSLIVSNRSGSCPTKNPFGQQQERPFLSGQCAH